MEHVNKIRVTDTKSFIEKSKLIYGNEFKYSKVDYIKTNIKVIIETKYGDCLVIPSNFLSGHKPNIKSAINKTKYYINKVKEVHGNKYLYNKVTYLGDKNKVEIICPKHGSWKTYPTNLTSNKHGCKKCGTKFCVYSDKEWEKRGKISNNFDNFKLYIIYCYNEKESFYKIGKTYLKIKKRFSGKTNMPYNYKVINVVNKTAKEICLLEKSLHELYKNYNYKPNIYFPGITECFKL